MGEESKNTLTLAVIIILFAVVAAIVISLFIFGKNTVNNGITKVNSSVDMMNNSDFTTYDQKTVSGSEIMNAYRTFEGQDVAILVASPMVINKYSKGADEGDLTGANGIETAYGATLKAKMKAEDGTADNYMKKVYQGEIVDGTVQANGSDYKVVGTTSGEVGLYVVNYGAILDTKGDGDRLAMYKGTIYANGGVMRDTNDNVVVNNITSNLGKTGVAEYVSQTGKFKSYCVKDASGTYCGVLFVALPQ